MNAWLSQPDEIHLAMNAALALNQMVDHFWHGFGSSDPARVLNAPDIETFRRELPKKNHDWGLVRDVAEAHEHVKLGRKDRSVTSAGQTVVVIPSVSGTSISGSGAYGGFPSVVVTRDDGSTDQFIDVAQRTFQMWKTVLA